MKTKLFLTYLIVQFTLICIIYFNLYNTCFSQNYEWAKNIGSTSDDYGRSITIDGLGNVYITGYFNGTADFDPSSGIANLTSSGVWDIFIAKYDSSGNYTWAKGIGSSDYEQCYSITVDASSNIYITGYFKNTVDFDPGVSTANLTSVGGNDIFFAKYDSSGNYIWAKSIGSTSFYDRSFSITIDDSNNVYIIGYFDGTADFDPGTGIANLTPVGSLALFFAKYDSSGNYIWAKSIESPGGDDSFSITTDNSGNVYISGGFKATSDFDPGPDTAILIWTGSFIYSDIFLAKYNKNGNYLWAISIGSITILGNQPIETSFSIATDTFSNVYITGYFNNIADFDPGAGTDYLTSVGSNDIFFAKYDSSGNYIWAKSIGSKFVDRGHSISVDSHGNINLTGYFRDTADFDPGVGISNLISVGGSDIFFAKYDTEGNYIWAKSIGSINGDVGHSIAVDNKGNVHLTGFFSGTADFDPGDDNVNLTPIGNNDIFLAKYIDCGIQTVYICLITVDSTSTKNEIVWEKPLATGIDSFKIYRDIVGTYTNIGSIAYEDLSLFVDTTPGVNPQITSYRYKISVLDTCGNESGLSDFHETMHLTASLGTPPPAINLVWDTYEGFPVSYYRILRDSTGLGNYEIIDSVSSSNFTYTDLTPPAGNMYYLIEAQHPTGCTATAKSKNFNKTRSNYQNRTITGINDQSSISNHKFKVFPNPYTGKTKITYTLLENSYITIEVYNLLGEKLETLLSNKQSMGVYQYNFSANKLGIRKGMHILKAIIGNNTYTKKLLEF